MKDIIRTQLQKWSNSSRVRLPKRIIEAAKLKDNQLLSVCLNDQSTVLTQIKTDNDLSLDKMLVGVTPKNTHSEIDWGSNVGAEHV